MPGLPRCLSVPPAVPGELWVSGQSADRELISDPGTRLGSLFPLT
ncbi:rCG44785 [Rattus norvegicus]|uniref:RCG44785 n=1 Tax=Rattus norvegicus TaxID=10116 RepID=A6I4R5_RAT|nr:rCG44785 [Rattus norvegicus]